MLLLDPFKKCPARYLWMGTPQATGHFPGSAIQGVSCSNNMKLAYLACKSVECNLPMCSVECQCKGASHFNTGRLSCMASYSCLLQSEETNAWAKIQVCRLSDGGWAVTSQILSLLLLLWQILLPELSFQQESSVTCTCHPWVELQKEDGVQHCFWPLVRNWGHSTLQHEWTQQGLLHASGAYANNALVKKTTSVDTSVYCYMPTSQQPHCALRRARTLSYRCSYVLTEGPH